MSLEQARTPITTDLEDKVWSRPAQMADGQAGGHFFSPAAGVGARIFLDVQITGRVQSIRGPLGPGARGDRLVWANGLRLMTSSTTSPASTRSGTVRQQSRSRVRTWLTCTHTATGQTASTQPGLKWVRLSQHTDPAQPGHTVSLNTDTEPGTPINSISPSVHPSASNTCTCFSFLF